MHPYWVLQRPSNSFYHKFRNVSILTSTWSFFDTHGVLTWNILYPLSHCRCMRAAGPIDFVNACKFDGARHLGSLWDFLVRKVILHIVTDLPKFHSFESPTCDSRDYSPLRRVDTELTTLFHVSNPDRNLASRFSTLNLFQIVIFHTYLSNNVSALE